jgi:hypothetical protein
MSHDNKVKYYSTLTSPRRQVTVVLGAQWGDEGKGKLVDLLTEGMQLVARWGHWACQILEST